MGSLIRPDWAGVSITKRTYHTPAQIIHKLTTADHLITRGQTVADTYRELPIS
jgi:hypothetical protein